MKNKWIRFFLYLLLALVILLLIIMLVLIKKISSPPLEVSNDISIKFQSNLDYVKINFSSLKDVKIKFSDTKNFLQEVGSAESYRLPFVGFRITIDASKFDNVSDDALRGFFAHELSHLEYYNLISWFHLLIYSIRYSISENYQIKVERNTDMHAIEKGFAQELLAYREYRLETANSQDIAFIKKRYLSPEEVKERIKHS